MESDRREWCDGAVGVESQQNAVDDFDFSHGNATTRKELFNQLELSFTMQINRGNGALIAMQFDRKLISEFDLCFWCNLSTPRSFSLSVVSPSTLNVLFRDLNAFSNEYVASVLSQSLHTRRRNANTPPTLPSISKQTVKLKCQQWRI